MSSRRQNEVRTAAAVARARAATQSNMMQRIAEKQRMIAAMSPAELQGLKEKTMRDMTEAVARSRSRVSNVPVRGNVTKAPMRGSTHYAHTAGSLPTRQQPSNSTTAHRPLTNEVVQQHRLLMSSDAMRGASSDVMLQYGWTKLPEDPQALILFREQVERIVKGKQRSRESRQRRREKRSYYRRQNAVQNAVQQQNDY